MNNTENTLKFLAQIGFCIGACVGAVLFGAGMGVAGLVPAIIVGIAGAIALPLGVGATILMGGGLVYAGLYLSNCLSSKKQENTQKAQQKCSPKQKPIHANANEQGAKLITTLNAQPSPLIPSQKSNQPATPKASASHTPHFFARIYSWFSNNKNNNVVEPAQSSHYKP